MPVGTLSDHLISKGFRSLKSFENHVKDIEYDFWNNRFKEYKKWKELWWRKYQKNGYVDLLTGFRCSGLMNQKEVTNYPVQGSAYHCLQWSFNKLDEIMIKEKWDTKLIGQIHDAILFDLHPGELNHVLNVVRRVTCEDLPKAWKWINTPLDVDAELAGVDESWADLKKFDFS